MATLIDPDEYFNRVTVVGLAVVGLAVVGLAVVGLSVLVGLVAVVGLSVLGLLLGLLDTVDPLMQLAALGGPHVEYVPWQHSSLLAK